MPTAPESGIGHPATGDQAQRQAVPPIPNPGNQCSFNDHRGEHAMSSLLLHLFPELRHIEPGLTWQRALWRAIFGYRFRFPRFTPKEAMAIFVAVFCVWLVGSIPSSIPWAARVALYYAGWGVAILGFLLSIRRQVRERILNVLMDFGIPICAFCGYSVRGVTLQQCPECGRLVAHSKIVAELRQSHTDPMVPELYECFDTAEHAKRTLAVAKRDIDFLWFCRRAICVTVGVTVSLGSVIAAIIAGVRTRSGSPEVYFVVPGVVLAFVLPVLTYSLILKLLRQKIRARVLNPHLSRRRGRGRGTGRV